MPRDRRKRSTSMPPAGAPRSASITAGDRLPGMDGLPGRLGLWGSGVSANGTDEPSVPVLDQSTVDRQRMAGHHGAAGGKEQDRLGDVGRRADAPHQRLIGIAALLF